MDRIIAAGALSLAAGQAGLEVAARNISQSPVAGYRRQTFSLEAGALGPVVSLMTDMRAGPVAATGQPGDLAIDGPGFFRVGLDGEQFLTRGGSFVPGAGGLLTGPAGQVLLDETGAPVRVSSGQYEVSPDGLVVERGVPVARLGLAGPADGVRLQAVGGSMFAAAGVDAVDPAATRVRQGALERSNVETAGEMTGMMLALRMAETGARLVQTYDGLVGQAVTALGRGLR